MDLVLQRLACLWQETFLGWCRNCRPRNNELFEAMKTLRAAFENILKFCWSNELRITKMDLAL